MYQMNKNFKKMVAMIVVVAMFTFQVGVVWAADELGKMNDSVKSADNDKAPTREELLRAVNKAHAEVDQMKQRLLSDAQTEMDKFLAYKVTSDFHNRLNEFYANPTTEAGGESDDILGSEGSTEEPAQAQSQSGISPQIFQPIDNKGGSASGSGAAGSGSGSGAVNPVSGGSSSGSGAGAPGSGNSAGITSVLNGVLGNTSSGSGASNSGIVNGPNGSVSVPGVPSTSSGSSSGSGASSSGSGSNPLSGILGGGSSSGSGAGSSNSGGGLLSNIGSALGGIFSGGSSSSNSSGSGGIGGFLSNVFGNLTNGGGLGGILSNVAGSLSNSSNGTLSTIGNILNNGVTGNGQFSFKAMLFNTIWNFLSKWVLKTVTKFINNLAGKIQTKLTGFINNLNVSGIPLVGNMLGNLQQNAAGAVTNIVNSLKTKALNFLQSMLTKAKNAIKNKLGI